MILQAVAGAALGKAGAALGAGIAAVAAAIGIGKIGQAAVGALVEGACLFAILVCLIGK